MRAKLLSTIVVMTGLIFGILLFSPNILSLNHSASVMAQTDDSTSSSFTLSNLIKQGSPYIGNLSLRSLLSILVTFNVIYVHDM